MSVPARSVAHLRDRLLSRMGQAALTGLVGLTWSATASAYIGDSFLSIPGQAGAYRGTDHKRWIRAEASEWSGRLRKINSGATDPLAGDKLFFGGPNAPRPGNSGKLILTLAKTNPDLRFLMDACSKKLPIAELSYAESSDRARPVLELGPRPAEFPAFWEYRLKGVQVADCPVLDGAEQQAIVLTFQDIEWLNYDANKSLANKVVVDPDDLPKVAPIEPSGGKITKSFLITWIAPATGTTSEQCPVLNTKPSDADVYRYLSVEEATQLRARTGEKGLTAGLQTELRGPHRLNVNLLPGVIPDPGMHEAQSPTALGIDLDGNDERGAPPKGVRKHRNYVSPDGRTGIDNQLFAVMGCIPGFRGTQGYRNQTSNARRADGNVVTLVEVSGIDNEQNDDHVEVAIIYAMDKPIRDNSGHKFIPGYTFRPATDPNFALYNIRVRGRIVNGVVETDRLPKFQANLGQDPLLELFNARMRFEPQPDGSMKGVIAGYRDWRSLADSHASGYSEGLFGYQQPALYYALKRNADGLYNPVTGEFDGISTVYEVDTVPAFLTAPAPHDARVAQGEPSARKNP